MKAFPKKYLWDLTVVMVIGLPLIFFVGCANVQHQASFNKNYLPKEDVCIKVAKAVNDTGYTFDIDIEQMLANTLEEQLMEEDLLCLRKEESNLFMETRIIDYKKGSAFKRWMMPGWGATELSIRCELKDDKNNLVGSAMSSREIVAGGLYTIGAWETIFKDVANDVAEDLKDQIQAQGYVVRSKTRPQATNQPKEMQKLTSNSEKAQTTKATSQSQEAPKLSSLPKDAPVVRVSLRRRPMEMLNRSDISAMLVEYNFFELTRNTAGSFLNDLVDNKDGTVTDRATGLMWQKSGSLESLDNTGASKYVEQLNNKRFAGYSDWRMPTIEELASLLARSRNKDVYMAPAFENHQNSCWSADQIRPSPSKARYWIVNFKQGQILEAVFYKPLVVVNWSGSDIKNKTNYVKAVRSVR